MRWFLTVSGVLILVAGLVVSFLGYTGVTTLVIVGFIGLLIAANLDRISEFKATGSGIEAKTREVREIITRAENTLSELQLLARNIGELTLSLVKRSGRFGGYADEEQEKIKISVLEVLKKVGIPEAEFPIIMGDWNRFTEFDYAHFILGGSTIPDTTNNAFMEEWRSLRDGGISNIPAPGNIRAFFVKHNLMTEKHNEYLQDYEHFLTYKVHRRPDVWAERNHWGRLKTP